MKLHKELELRGTRFYMMMKWLFLRRMDLGRLNIDDKSREDEEKYEMGWGLKKDFFS